MGDDLTLRYLGVTLVSIGTGEHRKLATEFNKIATILAADDAVYAHGAAAIEVPGSCGTYTIGSLMHGHVPFDDKVTTARGSEVTLQQHVVVDRDVAGDEVVVTEVVANSASVEHEASTAQGEIVSDGKRRIGVDAHVTGQTRVAGGQHHEP